MTKQLLLLALVFQIEAVAQAPAPIENLTLEQALLLALENHPKVAEFTALMRASAGRVREAGAFPNPEAVAGVESAPLRGRTAEEAEYLAGFSQPLPIGGRLSAARKVAEAGRRQSQSEMDLAVLEVTAEVRNAFATALYASEVFQARTNLIRSGEELIAVTQARVEAGDVTEIDLLRAQAEASQEKLATREAAAMKQRAMLALEESLGLSAARISSLAGVLESALNLEAINSLSQPLASHPAIASSEAELEARQAGLELAKRQRIPDLNLDLLYRRAQASRQNAFDAGIRMEIPLFNQGRGKVRAAEAELQAAEARLERNRFSLAASRERNRLLLASRIETATTLREAVLPKLEEASRVVELRYQAGDSNFADVLIARREYLFARMRYLEALHEVFASWAEAQSYLPHGRASWRKAE